MKILDAIIQGIIQGLSEFLPVSSSGHLSVFQHLFVTGGDEEQAKAAFLLSMVLHLGTLLAVCVAFRHTLYALLKEFFSMIKDIFTKNFHWQTMNGHRRMLIMLVISTAMIIPFYIFKDTFEGFATDNDIIVEGFCFLVTSFFLFSSDMRSKGTKEGRNITTANAVTVGLFQGVALMPGISRSGSTISGGLFCGFTRETAIRYSFIMGIPAILGGCLMELKDAFSAEASGSIDIMPYLIGFCVAAFVGLFAIRMVRLLMRSNKFRIFAYYTLILGVIVICIGVFEKIFDKPLMDFFK